ncbi:MAG TPA: ASKHA domain-containing protein [Thermodesulfobacteriota bacterium]|nr:ASKHA domain-containing protein [Thermodesulfobacteriota bacterium]
MKKFQVIFLPTGRRGEVSEGKTVLEASRELGVGIESVCGGKKKCGKCKVRPLQGDLSPFTEEEKQFIKESESAEGYRLGCAAQILGNVQIFIPEESRTQQQVVRKEASQRSIELKPAIVPRSVELSPPSLHDPLGDFDRLQKALFEKYHLPKIRIDYPALQKLSHMLRQGQWKVTVATWMDREILDVKPDRADDFYGIAIDVGTTTVAGYLCNLTTGELVATQSMMNPQVIYGEDVMSRIAYTVTHPDGLENVHRSIIDALNQLIKAVAQRSGLSAGDILELTIVGNTAMHHLFLKIDPQYLAVSPFTPVIHRSIDMNARDLGLKVHPSANVHILPVEAGFVGADNVGVLIAEEPYRQEAMVLIIDIGTNGELVLGNRKRLLSSSCATGPALEGAHIKFGMRAAPGAIERVSIQPDTLEVNFKAIGQENWQSEAKSASAIGICGSGIIDAVAELFRNKIILPGGRFSEGVPSPRFRISDQGAEFVVAWRDETSIGKDITITQQDIRNVQLAKAALYTGAKLMMKKLGIKKLNKVILAGAFGTYINTEAAMILGMFPDCDLKNVYAVGNAAGDGARIALLNRDKRAEAEEIARKVEYVELTTEKDFQKEFIDALSFPHARDSFPHLEGLLKE